MEGKYPIMIDGEQCGSLAVEKEGLMTVFHARCDDPGKMLKLSVYGDREGYLGLMMPRDGALELRKSYTREGMKQFPGEILYAGPAGMEVPVATFSEKEEQPDRPPSGEAGETATAVEEPESEPEAVSEQPLGETGDTFWRRDADGVLVSEDEDGTKMLAFLLRGAELHATESHERRVIEGDEYIVFKVKNGKIN